VQSPARHSPRCVVNTRCGRHSYWTAGYYLRRHGESSGRSTVVTSCRRPPGPPLGGLDDIGEYEDVVVVATRRAASRFAAEGESLPVEPANQ